MSLIGNTKGMNLGGLGHQHVAVWEVYDRGKKIATITSPTKHSTKEAAVAEIHEMKFGHKFNVPAFNQFRGKNVNVKAFVKSR